ncbi:MAG: hypothetical protein WC859_03895 [Elusimicrobiota bacterium]
MNRKLFILSISLISLLGGSAFGRTHTASNRCSPEDKKVIGSEARCFDDGGIDIGYNGTNGAKVACMQDKRVQKTCGPDGRTTRLQAYSQWYAKVKQFESDCVSNGGIFSYEDPNFIEPQNESYCLQAQPEIGTDMFEDSLCNYRSICPAVAVACQNSCGNDTAARPEEMSVTLQSAQANLPSLSDH